MDASSQPDKANPAAGHDNAVGPANIPKIDSPSLVPEQSEPAPATSASAEPTLKPSTALTLAAVKPQGEQAGSAEEVRKTARRLPNWRLTKISSLAASLALAVGAGVIAGAIGTLGLQRAIAPQASADAGTLQESIVRLSSELAAFKASAEASAKSASGQVTRLTERLDRTERAQVEPASRLARIADAVDRLEKRAAIAPIPPATVPAASPVAAPRTASAPPVEITGSVPPAPGSAPVPNKDLARLPVMPGWILHSVQGGAAIVQSRMGLMEVEVGDPLPGGGRVEAIRRDNGRWVVVTSRGLIVAR